MTAAPLAARSGIAIEESPLLEEHNNVRSDDWAADGVPDCTRCGNRVRRRMARVKARLTLQVLNPVKQHSREITIPNDALVRKQVSRMLERKREGFVAKVVPKWPSPIHGRRTTA
jgi:hypothetical protein